MALRVCMVQHISYCTAFLYSGILFRFLLYKNMYYLSGLIGSYIYGALLAKFQPDVLNPLVLICGCLLITLRDGRIIKHFVQC